MCHYLRIYCDTEPAVLFTQEIVTEPVLANKPLASNLAQSLKKAGKIKKERKLQIS